MRFPLPLTTFAPVKHGPNGAAPATSERHRTPLPDAPLPAPPAARRPPGPGVVRPDEFYAGGEGEAHATGRSPTRVERTGHPLDHPFGIPEAEYLKCLWGHVG